MRDGEVSLELPRKAAVLDFGILRKAETGPSERIGHAERRKHDPTASREADGCTLGWGWDVKVEIPAWIRRSGPG